MVSSRHLLLAIAAAPSAFAYTLTYLGCYSSSDGLTKNNTYTYQSDGYCQDACVADNSAPVMGMTNGNECYCGTEEPPTSEKVSDSNCNIDCVGYPDNICGGASYWSVYLTGTESDVEVSGGTTTSSTGSSTTSTTSAAAAATTSTTGTSTSNTATAVTSVAAGKTVVVTESAAASSATESATSSTSSKSHTAAIAAGAVVGVVAIAAIVGAALFYVRYRRRRAADEYTKENQVSSFMASTKPVIPAVRRSPSGPDSRFDAEAMAHRRLSDGSIADNEDFSRRILKVTNPDGR